MSFFSETLIYFVFILLAIVAGGLFPILTRGKHSHHPLLLSFSAGLMLGSAFLHLIPQSFELIGSQASLFILLGLLTLYGFERFITIHICEADHCEVHTLGLSAFIGLFLHSFTDGIALGAGLLIPRLGLIVFLAIFAHKAMEALALSSILVHAQKKNISIFLANFCLALAIPLGALIPWFFSKTAHPHTAGIALAFSAGTFLHISLSDLLPEVHRHSTLKTRAVLFFILGLLVMLGIEHWA